MVLQQWKQCISIVTEHRSHRFLWHLIACMLSLVTSLYLLSITKIEAIAGIKAMAGDRNRLISYNWVQQLIRIRNPSLTWKIVSHYFCAELWTSKMINPNLRRQVDKERRGRQRNHCLYPPKVKYLGYGFSVCIFHSWTDMWWIRQYMTNICSTNRRSPNWMSISFWKIRRVMYPEA